MSEYPDERFYPHLEQNWISINQDKNLKIYNSSQAINLYDFTIPILCELPCPEPDDIDIIIPSTEEENTEISNGESEIIIKKALFKTRTFLRGRKRNGNVDIGQIKIHDKISKDNILRKLNVCFLNFAIELANEIVQYFRFDGKFIDLGYNFKKNITKKSLKKLKSLTFGDLLRKDISKKWKKLSSDANRKFYDQVIKNENIEKFFSQKYMTIFKIFLESQRNIKVADVDYYLPPKIMMFDAFLLSIKNKYNIDETSSYIIKIKEVIEEYKK